MTAPLTILRCPETRLPLDLEPDGRLVTPDRERAYASINGVPVLLTSGNPLFPLRAADPPDRRSSVLRRLKDATKRLLPSHSLAIGSKERYQELMVRLSRGGPRSATVLVVGGGGLGQGMEALVEAPNLSVVETDVYLGPRVDVICDAHDLPFADGVFDAVVIQAVLEHVLSPDRVVQELHRVLKRDGLVYSETPFMQQVHEGPYDFTRFTDMGHRCLFRSFDELNRGVVCGPAMSLVWSIRYLARALPRRSRSASAMLDAVATMLFFWLKYLDRWLVDHPGARDGASGLFFLGRRRDGPIADAALLGTYVGSVGSPFSGSSPRSSA